LNRPIDVPTAEAIVSTFIEAVIAPAVDDAAREVLARKSETCASSRRLRRVDGCSRPAFHSRRGADAGTRSP